MLTRLRPLLAALLLAPTLAAASDDIPASLSAFPYPLIAAPGGSALETWQSQRGQGTTPVIIGDEQDAIRLLDDMSPEYGDARSPQEIIAAAKDLNFPEAIKSYHTDMTRQLIASLSNNGQKLPDFAVEMQRALQDGSFFDLPEEIEGQFTQMPEQPPALLSLTDYATGQPKETVFIALLPDPVPAHAPAYLKTGGWNANPPAEVHIAVFRDLNARYDAVPAVMMADTFEFLAETRPQTETEARALAEAFYIYCNDIVDQGVGDIGALASLLAASNMWYFWWD